MRQLKAKDVFPMIRLINMLDLKTEIYEMKKTIQQKQNQAKADGETVEVDVEKNGLEFIFKMLEKASTDKMEKAVFDFLARPMECTADELFEMDLIELMQTIKKNFDWENWNNFFTTVKSVMVPKSENSCTDDTMMSAPC